MEKDGKNFLINENEDNLNKTIIKLLISEINNSIDDDNLMGKTRKLKKTFIKNKLINNAYVKKDNLLNKKNKSQNISNKYKLDLYFDYDLDKNDLNNNKQIKKNLILFEKNKIFNENYQLSNELRILFLKNNLLNKYLNDIQKTKNECSNINKKL